jgi:signal transduction histidine kinase
MQKRGSKKLRELELRELAAALSQAYSAGSRAGRALHDGVGPLLTGAGLRLQLLSMDHPKTGEAVGLVLQALDQAVEQVRQISESLAPSPTYRIGIHGALEKLVKESQADFPGTIRLKFSATAKLEPELTALFYDAIASVLGEAMARPGSTKVTISVTGIRRMVTARVQDNGRVTTRKGASIPRLLAEEAGFVFSQTTIKGTIVLIRHGIPRPPRG